MRTLTGRADCRGAAGRGRGQHRPRLVLWRGQLQARRLLRAGQLRRGQAALLHGDEDLPRGRVRASSNTPATRKCYETVYDTKTVECCKMVRETHYRECTLHGLQAGLRDALPHLQLHRLQAGVGNADQERLLHGLQAGLGNPHQEHLLHRLQARLSDAHQAGLLHGLQARL